MSRQRETREQKALAFLRLRRRASAAEIGWAAAKGEGPAGYWRFAQAQNLGLALAMQLVRDGIARATPKNEFEFWKEPPGESRLSDESGWDWLLAPRMDTGK